MSESCHLSTFTSKFCVKPSLSLVGPLLMVCIRETTWGTTIISGSVFLLDKEDLRKHCPGNTAEAHDD